MVDLHDVARYDRPFPVIRSFGVGPNVSLMKMYVGSIYLAFYSNPLYFCSLPEFDEKRQRPQPALARYIHDSEIIDNFRVLTGD